MTPRHQVSEYYKKMQSVDDVVKHSGDNAEPTQWLREWGTYALAEHGEHGP